MLTIVLSVITAAAIEEVSPVFGSSFPAATDSLFDRSSLVLGAGEEVGDGGSL